jgi:hypothetical protein
MDEGTKKPILIGDFDIDMQLHTLVETWIQFFKVYYEALEEQHIKVENLQNINNLAKNINSKSFWFTFTTFENKIKSKDYILDCLIHIDLKLCKHKDNKNRC